MAELFQKNGRVSVLGTEVLRWRVSLPIAGEKIAAFYGEIGARAVGYCEGALWSLAEREFEESEEKNKRFSFPSFSYRLEGKITYEDEQFLSLCLVAELRRRGGNKALGHFEDGQVWEKKTEVLLPPEEVIFQCCGTHFSRKEKKTACGILLSSDSALWYDGKSWTEKKFKR